MKYNWKIVLQSNLPYHKSFIGTSQASTISEVIKRCRNLRDYRIKSITRRKPLS